jgi:tetratricopeptide (TPR) repeat protein
VAYGGTGKSTFINKWLEKMRWDNYRGAKKVYGWSFYSQGTNELATSADRFVNHALEWFGDEDPLKGSPWDKGKRLAHLAAKQRTLMILDGMEPLQSTLDFERGKIKDNALCVLVTELAKHNNGLCIITTREQSPELNRFPAFAQTINLDQISNEAGRALLRMRNIQGSDAELDKATEAFGNHALAINLLAEYIHLFPGHIIQKAYEIPDYGISESETKHARRVIQVFSAYFGNSPETELLHIMGLFNRPAEMAAIAAIVGGKTIDRLTNITNTFKEPELMRAIQNLRNAKLLARESRHCPDIIDCHPIIREHFGEKLQTENPTAWKEANSRLYDYYKKKPAKQLPDTLEEMEPLFAAVAHGCRAGRVQEALLEVYWERIGRRNEFYSTNKLGAFGAFVATLSNFFEKLWTTLASGLNEHDKASVLNWAGFGLHALGRLRQAAEPMRAALQEHIKQKNWKESALDNGNLSELYLTLGDVIQAITYGRQSVEFAVKVFNFKS